MIAAVWTPQAKLNNKVNFQIINEVRLYWCLQIIIFQMHLRLTNQMLSQMLNQMISQMLRRNHLPVRNLSLTNNPIGLKNTGREILMVAAMLSLVLALQFLVLVSPTQTCKSFHKKVKMANNTVVPTCNCPITQCLTPAEAKRKKEQTKYKKETKASPRTLQCFKIDNNSIII